MEPKISLGVHAATGRPIEVPVSLLGRHAHIMGMTGASKSLSATSIACQLIQKVPGACVAVPDFGGDQYEFHRIRLAALGVGKRFRFLSTNPADDWDTFEPLRAVTPLTWAGIPRAASYCVSSLSLDHAEGFGKSYFSRMNYAVFVRTFTELVTEGFVTPTLRDLAERISHAARRTRLSDLSEAQLAAEQVLPYEQLSAASDPDRHIDVARCLEDGEVVYGFLPTLMEPPARMIGALLVWSFVLEAMRRSYAGLPPRQVFILIDEFASVAAAKAFADLLTLARKYHIALILLNQTSTQLVSRDRDLRPIVFDNTALKIWFTPLGDDIDLLRGLSRDVTKPRGKTVSSRGLAGSVSLSEVYEPDLERNDVLGTAFTGLEAFVIANEFRGHQEPQRLRFVPEVSREEHARLSNTPLPKRQGPRPAWRPGGARSQPADPARAARVAALAATLAGKRRDENWQAA